MKNYSLVNTDALKNAKIFWGQHRLPAKEKKIDWLNTVCTTFRLDTRYIIMPIMRYD